MGRAWADGLQQDTADGCLCAQGDLPGRIGQGFQLDDQISVRQGAGSVFRPFRQFQPRAGKDVTKAGVFPLARVIEAIEIKVPDGEAGQFIGLDHRVGGTFDPALDPECAQQMAHQSGLARTQLTAQFNESML